MEKGKWKTIEREDRLLGTDVFVSLSSDERNEKEIKKDLDQAFSFFRDFEQRFSRFEKASELSLLNQSESMQVSEMLFDMLAKAKEWKKKTQGRFDVGVLPILESEGYRRSFNESGIGGTGLKEEEGELCFEYDLFSEARRVRKPLEMKIDLGGIGKGYAVDHVRKVLSRKYDDFIVDAGGDMYVSGEDKENGYKGFAIAVENPFEKDSKMVHLLLSGKAVATSGRNRRRWMKDGKEKHHLIDVKGKKSSESDILQVSVLADSVEEADIRAKHLFFLGSEEAVLLGEREKIDAFFVCADGKIFLTNNFEHYVWK